MQQEHKYKVLFKGEVLPGFDIATVNKSMTTLFSLNPSEVSPLFEGETIFKRSDLNKFTADQYAASFRKIGALCYVEKELDNQSQMEPVLNQTSQQAPVLNAKPGETIPLNPNVCPKCQSANINSEQCLDCGIYIEKYNKNIARSSQETSKKELVEENLDYLTKSIKIIKYVAIYMLVVFTVDSFLEGNGEGLRYVIDSNFYIGVLPYVLGHFGLAVGCYYLALAKGHSGNWGILGLASLPGLAVLLLLPNKYETEPERKTKAFAVVLILLSVYWTNDYVTRDIVQDEFFESSLVLRDNRHEYPSKTLDSDAEVFESEIKELDHFLDKGFAMLSNYGYRNHEESAIAYLMFSETMRLFIWIQYQQYLQFRNGSIGPDYLKFENINKIKINIFKKIFHNVSKSVSFNLGRVFKNWFIGFNYFEGDYKYPYTYNKATSEILDKITTLRFFMKDGEKPYDFSFDKITLPPSPIVTMTTEDDVLLLDFSKTKLLTDHKKVAVAFYYQPYRRYKTDKVSYSMQRVQISPDFPNMYLGGLFKVFDGADTIPFLNEQKNEQQQNL